MTKKEQPSRSIIVSNNKARFEYEILDTYEAGIVLVGSEVKALRSGKANIAEAHGEESDGELWLFNMNISTYKEAHKENHEQKRPRKLLLHKTQINKILGRIKEKGLTLVPLNLYFNSKGLVKIEIGIGKGKKLHDKRDAIAKRDQDRESAREAHER
jgi:SsrA-binding protein